MKSRTLAESSELLRIALPLMARHVIPVTPENYTVWYEYAAGDKRDLKERMDYLIDNNHAINEEVTCSLRKNYFDGNADVARNDRSQEKLLTISEGLQSSLVSACGEANLYDESLEQYQEKITEDLKAEQLASLISQLSTATGNMNKRNKELIRDLEQTRKETEELRKELILAKKEAKTDPLTQLANRTAFLDCFESLDKSGKLVEANNCILLADIDKFKLVNDTYGHIFGDKVIRAVAKIIQDNTKGKDLPARFGGEEFVILLPDTSLQGAAIVAETIREKLELARITKPGTGEIIGKTTISIGVTALRHDDDIETSISKADKALYQAKADGRNKVVIYTEELTEES